jgi:signal peptidase I
MKMNDDMNNEEPEKIGKVIKSKSENHNEKGKRRIARFFDVAIDILFLATIVVVGIGCFHYGRRIFIAEKFIIPTYSMYPTLIPGDRIMVNKLYHGARLYRSFDFSDHAPMESLRMPGFRKIRPGDLVVFNEVHPYGDWSKIEFKINKVFCKRVLGTPGDSISIVDGINRNNRHDGPIGLLEAQQRMNSMPDSLFMQNFCLMAYPMWRSPWTIKNMGPLYVPAKGDYIPLDEWHCTLYGQIIEYETSKHLEYKDGTALLDSIPTDIYTFQDDYYYMLGDNSPDSNDSRYWGFVPGRFIVGVATRIIYCRDRQTERFRWDRLLKRI